MARGRGGELLFARKFDFHRPAGFECGKRRNVLNQHFLLRAEAAAHTLAKYPDLFEIKIEDLRKRAARQEWRLCAGANVQPSIIHPSHAMAHSVSRWACWLRGVV